MNCYVNILLSRTIVIPVVILSGLMITISACNNTQSNMNQNIDIQGHRGCRGLLPENTIPAFIRAVAIGVHTLELDVVTNKAGDVIISHEPFFNHEISIGPNGEEITEENERDHNLYPLSISEIQAYDVGMKAHPRFSEQKKMKINKPLLSEMVEQIEEFVKDNNYELVNYNIEIKRVPDHDGSYHLPMKEFADVVCKEIESLGIKKRTTVQCFDVETLQYLNENHPTFDLVYLIQNMNSIQTNIETLGFVPSVYSPYFKLITPDVVSYCKNEKIKLIPWTVNEASDITDMLDLKVDGIISDFPDRVVEIHRSRQPQ